MALKYIKPVIEKVELLTEECLAEGGSTCNHTYWGSSQCKTGSCSDGYWKSPSFAK